MAYDKAALSKYFTGLIEEFNSDDNAKKDKVANYELWAEDYEKDEEILGYSIHTSLVDFLENCLKSESHLNKSSAILDIAAGTGLVGKELRNKGFIGQLDGHDGSEKMLEVAKRKEGVYNQLYCHMIYPNSALPDQLSSESYDIVTICAAVRIGCITEKNIKQLLSCLRVGGLFTFTMKMPPSISHFEFRFAVERECFELEEQGYLQLVDMKLCRNYRKAIRDSEKIHPPSMFLYCYKKLKSFIAS